MVQGSHLKSRLFLSPLFQSVQVLISNRDCSYLPCFNPFKVPISNRDCSYLPCFNPFKVPISNRGCSYLHCFNPFKVPISNRGCSYLHCFNPFKVPISNRDCSISIVSIRSRFPSQIVTALSPLFQSVQVPISNQSYSHLDNLKWFKFPSQIRVIPILII